MYKVDYLQVWTYHLLHQLKEHQATVTCIKIRKNDEECVSSSDDGTCIMWDLRYIKSYSSCYSSTVEDQNCWPASKVRSTMIVSVKPLIFSEVMFYSYGFQSCLEHFRFIPLSCGNQALVLTSKSGKM